MSQRADSGRNLSEHLKPEMLQLLPYNVFWQIAWTYQYMLYWPVKESQDKDKGAEEHHLQDSPVVD